MTEEDIIQELTKGQRKAPERFGIGDDAALIVDNRIITHDTMVESIHWDNKLSPADVGWKLVAINVSDIGAMGGVPEWCTLSLSVPENTDFDWIQQFSQGMRSALQKWSLHLIGGDTTRSPNSIVASMAMGSRRGYNWAWQHTAEIGDDIWVTGTLGDAASGFFEPSKHAHNTALQRPIPPSEFGQTIAHNKIIHAMIDISDGLYADLTRLCTRSAVGARIDPKSLPASSVLYNNKKALAYQTAFGEDYEYLFTANPKSETLLRRLAARQKVTIHKIGKILDAEHNITLDDTSWPSPLFSHFKESK
jgi:thiamine-monophosphate kinase